MSSDSSNASDPEAYDRLASTGRAEHTAEGSRFIAFAWPVDSEAHAESLVQGLRDQYHDARHVCYGLRVGHGAQRIDRSNDDGEPPRTGGFPLWQLLEGQDLEDSMIAVVRYFGGTKLGMGGLRRAYREAGRLALHDAGVITHHPTFALQLIIDYDRYDEVCHRLEQVQACSIVDRDFAAQITLNLRIWRSQFATVIRQIASWLQVSPQSLVDDPDILDGS